MKNAVKVLAAPATMLGLLAVIVFACEGPFGFRPFLNLEAAAVVVAGTALALSVSFPLDEVARALAAALSSDGPAPREAEVLDSAAGYAMAMGWIGTLLGSIMLLSSVADVGELPRRFALALDSLLFGMLLSKLVLAPAARRLQAPASTR